MDDPERGTQQGDVFNQNAFALVEIDHLWAQTACRTKLTLVHGNAVLGIFQQAGTGTHVLGDTTLLHAKLLAATPRPPCFVASATIDGTLTGNSDVLCLIGIDQW